MENDRFRFIVVHEGPYVRSFEAAVGYVHGTGFGQNAEAPRPDQYVNDGFDESWLANLLLDDLTQLR